MSRLFLVFAGFAIAIMAADASAQGIPHQPHSAYDTYLDHDYWHHDPHVPDVAQLDDYADQLAKVARHLHEDAHKLSQDYEHSQAIEYYVDRVDRLQQHLHGILHQASQSQVPPPSLIAHVKSDVRQVTSWLHRLYGELHHQGFDGARSEDYHAMVHMRQIILKEAFPLIRAMEVAIDGNTFHDPLHSFHGRSPVGGTWNAHRVYIHH